MGVAAHSVEIPFRETLSAIISARLADEKDRLRAEFEIEGRIPSCVVDNLLPEEMVQQIYEGFPSPSELRLLNTLRERKFVGAQLDRLKPILEEAVYAFQDPDVIQAVEEISGIKGLEPDEHLYAGGISLMKKGNYLNPHLDNSHDKDRERYRALNLLFYVSPGWETEDGGNLELWDHGPSGAAREVVSRFNRLVIMKTNRNSWHSVNEVRAEKQRCCVSNYYFCKTPLDSSEFFHVTTYRGRPEQPFRNVLLKSDAAFRMMLRKIFPRGVRENPHVYKKGRTERKA